jgi:hypothetical protein
METPRSASKRSLLSPAAQLSPSASFPQKTPRQPKTPHTPSEASDSGLTPRRASDAALTPRSSSAHKRSSLKHDKEAREQRRRVQEEQVLARIEEAVKAARQEMASQIDQLEKAKADLTERLAEQNQVIQSLREGMLLTEAAKEGRSRADISKLERELAAVQQELVQARQSVDGERQASKKLAEDLRMTVDQKHALEMKLEGLQAGSGGGGSEVHGGSRTPSLEAQIIALSKANAELEKRARIAEASAEERQRDCERLEQFNQTVSAAAQSTQRSSEGEIDRMSQEISLLRRKLQYVGDIEAGFRQQLASKDEEIQSLSDLIGILQGHNAALKSKLNGAAVVVTTQDPAVIRDEGAPCVPSPSFALSSATVALDLSSITLPRQRSFTEYPGALKAKASTTMVITSPSLATMPAAISEPKVAPKPTGPTISRALSLKIATPKSRVIKRTPRKEGPATPSAVEPEQPTVAAAAKKKPVLATKKPTDEGKHEDAKIAGETKLMAPTQLSLLRRQRATSSGSLPRQMSQPLYSSPAQSPQGRPASSSSSPSSPPPPRSKKSQLLTESPGLIRNNASTFAKTATTAATPTRQDTASAGSSPTTRRSIFSTNKPL